MLYLIKRPNWQSYCDSCRCPQMTGVVGVRLTVVERFPADVCAVAATSRRWGMMTAATLIPAPKPHQNQPSSPREKPSADPSAWTSAPPPHLSQSLSFSFSVNVRFWDILLIGNIWMNCMHVRCDFALSFVPLFHKMVYPDKNMCTILLQWAI